MTRTKVVTLVVSNFALSSEVQLISNQNNFSFSSSISKFRGLYFSISWSQCFTATKDSLSVMSYTTRMPCAPLSQFECILVVARSYCSEAILSGGVPLHQPTLTICTLTF